jgi:hypothetical protein
MASEHKPGGHKLWHAMYMARKSSIEREIEKLSLPNESLFIFPI